VKHLGFIELEDCLFAPITIRQIQRSATSSLAIRRLIDPSLESVTDQTGYQRTQRDMPLLSNFTQVAKKIVGQNNGDFVLGSQDSLSRIMVVGEPRHHSS